MIVPIDSIAVIVPTTGNRNLTELTAAIRRQTRPVSVSRRFKRDSRRRIYACASIGVSMHWRLFLMHRMLMTQTRRDHTHNRRVWLETRTVAEHRFYVQYRDARPENH